MTLVNAEKIYQEFIQRSPQSTLVPYALEALGATMSAQGPQRDGEAVIALNQAALRSRYLNARGSPIRWKSSWPRCSTTNARFPRPASMWDHLVVVSTQPAVRAESMFRAADALSRQQYYSEAINKWKGWCMPPRLKAAHGFRKR